MTSQSSPATGAPAGSSIAGLAAVLWDMDGTLLSTESIWMLAETTTMESYGSHWDAQDQAVAVGGPADRVLRYMADRVGRTEEEVGERLLGEMERLMAESTIDMMPGVRHLHDALAAAGIPQALVSNSWRGLIDSALGELHTTFDLVIAGDEVERGKPDPLPYRLAAETLGVAPRDCVVIEDSATGVTSGLAAGATVLGVPHVGELRPHPRLHITDSLVGWTPERLAELLLQRRG